MSSPLTLRWLQHVWAHDPQPQLYYCIFALNPQGGRIQRLVGSIEQAAQLLAMWDERGWDTYYACALFRTPASRKQANVHSLNVFWEDVDAGPDKPYPDAPSAALAVAHACRTSGIPPPIYVLSGRGLHIYWLLEAPIPPETWLPIAHGLKGALRAASLALDPARATDQASVLRAPGTHHHKTGQTLEVQWDGKAPITPLAALAPFAQTAAQSVRAASFHPTPTTALLQSAVSGLEPAADAVADHCRQLAEFRLNGDVPEPLWHAFATILVRCPDGQDKWDKWSKQGFPGYDPAEAAR